MVLVVKLIFLVAALATIGLVIWASTTSTQSVTGHSLYDFDLPSRRKNAVLQHQHRWAVQPGTKSSTSPLPAAVTKPRVFTLPPLPPPSNGSIAATRRIVDRLTASDVSCPSSRRPYHVLLTASTGKYQEWQSRIFFYHYVKLKREYPCSDVSAQGIPTQGA